MSPSKESKSSGNKRTHRQKNILQPSVQSETNGESGGDNKTDNSQTTDKLSNSNKRINKRHETRFQKSGMKKGCLFKYFVKDDPELVEADPNYPLSSNAVNATVGSSRNNLRYNFDNRMDDIDTHSNNGSECSDIEFICEVPQEPIHNINKPPEVVDLSSSINIVNDTEDKDDAKIKMPEEGGTTSDSENRHRPDTMSPKLGGSPNSSTPDVQTLVRHRHHRKRNWNKVVGQSTSNDFQYLSKTTRMEGPDNTVSTQMEGSRSESDENIIVQTQLEATPVREYQELLTTDSQTTLTPPIKIVNTYTLCTPVPSTTIPISSTSVLKENAKRKVLVFKEHDNPKIQQMITKAKWPKWFQILQIMEYDLNNYNVPLKTSVIEVIRQVVLNENTRVNKEVSNLVIKFLQTLTLKYPASKDESITYYKGILKMIFGYKNKSGIECGTTLFEFLENIYKRVESNSELDQKIVQFLLLVTNLVEEQYEYFKKERLKLRPSFLQLFLEKVEGKLDYDTGCRSLVSKLFTCKKIETFCIYVKWVDMIAKYLHCHRQKEFEKMVCHVKDHCLEERKPDLGLRVFMNLKCRELSTRVCQEIFKEKLSYQRLNVPTNQPSTSKAWNPASITEKEKYSYLTHLAGTDFIRPALGVVSNETKESCGPDQCLEFIRTNMSYFVENTHNMQTGTKRNAKGETRFHIVGRLDKAVENPLADFKRLLVTHPYDINVQDNFGNTVLHDCARYDRQPILVAIWERASAPGSCLAVDLKIQNQMLETPLHLAATFSKLAFVEVFKYFAMHLNIDQELLLIPNALGKVPFEVASSIEIKQKLLPEGYDEDIIFCNKGIRLTSESKELLEENFYLKKILAWWSKNRNSIKSK